MPLTLELMTYDDLIGHLTDFLGANPTSDARRDARRAIASALRTLPNEHSWSYLTQQGRVTLVGAITSGTISYDHTAGGRERLVTFDSPVVPEWATYGVLVIADVMYEVAEFINTSSLTLSINSNPGADISAGTSATLFRDTYPMPADFISADQMFSQDAWRRLEYVHPREWLLAHRFNLTSSGTPFLYTIVGDPNYQGAMAVRFYPFPDTTNTVDFMYKRRSRPLRVEAVQAGTVSVTAASSTVSGDGTAFTSSLIGSVIRLSADKIDYPTGRIGSNPFSAERVVMSVASSSSLSVDQNFDDTLTEVNYRISDPLDLDPGVMTTVFLRLCEREIGVMRRMDDRAGMFQVYEDALVNAKEADVRTTSPRTVGKNVYRQRLAYHPAGPDVE